MPAFTDNVALARALPPLLGRYIAPDELIYAAGDRGIAWRIASGVVRLDRPGSDEVGFAGLALSGDLIGVETLLLGQYSLSARAIKGCQLLAWSPSSDDPSSDTMARIFSAIERRAADALALRCGDAFDRMRRLFRLLADEQPDQATIQVTIPSLKDMAEMTGLTRETASRTITQFVKSGLLIKLDRHTGLVEAGHF